jgi:hypothetical protein
MFITMLILGITVAFTIVNLVAEAILKFQDIVEWFEMRRARLYGNSLTTADMDRVGFTLQDLMTNGDYQTVQGVFNKANKTVETGARAVRSKDIDGDLEGYHRNNRLVIYS